MLETGNNTGVFTGRFALSRSGKRSNAIKVRESDRVSIEYETEFHADYDKKSANNRRKFFYSIAIGSFEKRLFRNETMLNRLKMYVDPKLFKRLQLGDDLLWTKTKEITVVFWDIRGFSKMCELLKAEPTIVMNFLKDYFSLANDVILAHGGLLDKFIGDGTMALFGIFGEHESMDKHTVNAVDAALEFRDKFEKLVDTSSKKWSETIPQKIDIGKMWNQYRNSISRKYWGKRQRSVYCTRKHGQHR